ncbi:hypothetical protein EMIT0P253_20333 [Pseudomonas sp. IT-P253]
MIRVILHSKSGYTAFVTFVLALERFLILDACPEGMPEEHFHLRVRRRFLPEPACQHNSAG